MSIKRGKYNEKSKPTPIPTRHRKCLQEQNFEDLLWMPYAAFKGVINEVKDWNVYYKLEYN